MTEKQQELDGLLLLLRGLISVAPIMTLVNLIQRLTPEEFEELKSSGKLKETVDIAIKATRKVDQILKELDIQYWGQPMGLTTITEGVEKNERTSF